MPTPEALTAAVVPWLYISLPISTQQAGKMPLVGVLLINTAADPEPARSPLVIRCGATTTAIEDPLQADVLVVENDEQVP